MQNFKEQNFVAYVNRENLYEVAHEMIKFLNDGDSFIGYKRPRSFIEREKIDVEEAIKRHTLI